MKTVLDKEDLVFNPPEPGCVLYLPGLPGGASKIHDRSPYGNHGTITGATWVRLPSGLWCLSFDGSDDHVNCGSGDSLNPTSAMSVMAWVKFAEFKTGQCISSKYDGNGWIFGPDPNTSPYDALRFKVWGATNGHRLGATHLSADTWYHICGVYESSDIHIYLNSILDDGTTGGTIPAAITPSATALYIARYSSVYTHGDIALFRMCNSGLTALGIQNCFNREKHLFGVW